MYPDDPSEHGGRPRGGDPRRAQPPPPPPRDRPPPRQPPPREPPPRQPPPRDRRPDQQERQPRGQQPRREPPRDRDQQPQAHQQRRRDDGRHGQRTERTGPSTLLQPPSLEETQVVPARTADQWARQQRAPAAPPRPPPREPRRPRQPPPRAPQPEPQPGEPRTANERRDAARREASRQAAAAAAARRAERRGGMLGSVGPSIARASGSMAIATLVSRITGFVRNVLIVAVLGLAGASINDAYQTANTLPNMLLEFVLGGVLTSVAVPVMVRAQKEDPDGGQAYTQRLVTMAVAVLATATVIAVIAAPLLVGIYVTDRPGSHTADVATVLAYLLLPEIFFYGLSALFNGILNSRDIFGPTAWAPVLNNLVVFAAVGAYVLVPGEITLNPVSISEPKLLVLGIGTTLGIVAQALSLMPSLRRTGFRFRFRWGFDDRLREFGGLALWSLGYVAVSQLGRLIMTRVATGTASGGLTIYNLTWLLVQLPYGVIGFSLLTAILPRMSRAAAGGDTMGVIGDLSFAIRMCTVMLGPISAVMTVLGPQIGLGLFSLGNSSPTEATRLGLALTTSAFGLLPYTITMVQLRAFYAMKDSRTPTLLMVVMVAVKIPLFFLCTLLPGTAVVYGLTAVNGLGFVVGAGVGQWWLRGRLGDLDTAHVLGTLGKTFLASVWGAAAALAVSELLEPFGSPVAMAWPTLVLGGVAGLGVTLGGMWLLRVAELAPAVNRVVRLVKRS